MRTGNRTLLGTLLVILIDVGWAIVGPSDWGNGQCVLGNLQLSMVAKIIPAEDETHAELSIPDSSTVTCANVSGSTDQYKIRITWSSWESDPVTTTAEASTTKPSDPPTKAPKGTTQFLEDSNTAKASTTTDEQTEKSAGYRDFPILYDGTSSYENKDYKKFDSDKISESNLEELTSTESSIGTTSTKMSTTEMSTSLKPEESTGILGEEREENADVSSISTTDGFTTFIVTTENSTSTSDVIASTTDNSTLIRDLRTLATDASTTTTDGSTSTQDLNTLATGDTSTTDASTSTSGVCASSTDGTPSTVHSTDINLFSGDSHQPSTTVHDGTTDVTTSYEVLTEHLLPNYESTKLGVGFEKLTEGTRTRITRSCPPYCDKDDLASIPTADKTSDNRLTFTLTRKDSLFTVSDVSLEFKPPNKEDHADCNGKYEKENVNDFCRTAEVIMITIGSFLGVLLVGSLGFYAGKLYCKSRRERDARRDTLP